MDRSENLKLAFYGRADRLVDLLTDAVFLSLPEDLQRTRLGLDQTLICHLAQDYVRSLDACYAGCVDLQDVYAARSGHARNRFRNMLDREVRALQAVGLWKRYNNSPDEPVQTIAGDQDSTAFDRACTTYWNNIEADSTTLTSRVSALPSMLRGIQAASAATRTSRNEANSAPPR